MASCSFELLTGFINIDRFERVESIFNILVQCYLPILQLICKIRVFLRLVLDRRKKQRLGGKVEGNLGLNYFFTEESPLSEKYSQSEVSDNTSRRIFKSYLSLLTFWYMVEI